MPITISVLYRTYEAAISEERRPSLEGATCPRLGCGAVLEWTTSTVERGIALLEADRFGVLTVVHVSGEIGLARCSETGCARRFRVLPGDVVPRKRYSLPVIERVITAYTSGAQSLRRVVWGVAGERVCAHTTLHGWTEGLGAYVLGRAAGEIVGEAPMSRLWVETESRRPELADVRRQQPFVDPLRYRSEGRHDRLGAVAVLLRVSPLASGTGHPHSLTAWRLLALRWTASCLFLFRTSILCTRIERGIPSEGRPCSSPSKRSRNRWPTPTRSPPGASNR